MPIITLNGKVTYEDCPVCGTPDMKVEHGHDEHGSFRHIETCSECGISCPIVCYDCANCIVPSNNSLHATAKSAAREPDLAKRPPLKQPRHQANQFPCLWPSANKRNC